MDSEKRTPHEKPNIKGDRVNIMLLVLMYTLQSLISGFVQAFPIIFQNRKVSYADQAEFSFTGYPFCFKLLWAPIVDCVFSKRIGRRKTWIMPMQYLIGLTLLYVSMNLDDLLGSEDGTRKPQIRSLGILFFFAQIFSAIQDVALDGWALTIVQRRNVGHAGLSQSLGSVIGVCIAQIGFLILDSTDFSNHFRTVPLDRGFVTLSEFLFWSSMVFMVSTTLIFIFKKDNSLEVIDDENCECKLGLRDSYTHLWNIFKLRPMLKLCFLLLTFYIGFGPAMGVAHLKMIDAGIPRDTFALLTIPALPLQIISSIVLRRYVTGPQPLHSAIANYILLLVTAILESMVLFFLPFVKDYQQQSLPSWYYCVLFFLHNSKNVLRYLMIVFICTFFYRISDPRYGGIYMTLMNTVITIGIRWPQTISLWCVDLLTIRTCDADQMLGLKKCSTIFDGYYTEAIIFSIIAFLWILWGRRQIYRLERLEPSVWIVERGDVKTSKDEKISVSAGNSYIE